VYEVQSINHHIFIQCVVVHPGRKLFIINVYTVSPVVQYLQNAFSSVSSVRFTLEVPDICCQSGSPFEITGAVVSIKFATSKFIT